MGREYSVCLPNPSRFAVVVLVVVVLVVVVVDIVVGVLWNRCRHGTRIFDLLAQPLPLCCRRSPRRPRPRRRRRRRHRRRRRRRLCPHRHQPRRQHDVVVVVVVGVIIDMVAVGKEVAASAQVRTCGKNIQNIRSACPAPSALLLYDRIVVGVVVDIVVGVWHPTKSQHCGTGADVGREYSICLPSPSRFAVVVVLVVVVLVVVVVVVVIVVDDDVVSVLIVINLVVNTTLSSSSSGSSSTWSAWVWTLLSPGGLPLHPAQPRMPSRGFTDIPQPARVGNTVCRVGHPRQ